MKLNAQQYAAAKELGLSATFHNLTDFAEACYNDNSFDDLKNFRTATADDADMENWNIDADRWREAQEEAIEYAMAYYEDENS